MREACRWALLGNHWQQLWAWSNQFPQEMAKESWMTCLPLLSLCLVLMILIAVAQGCFLSKLSFAKNSYDGISTHERDMNHSRVDIFNLRFVVGSVEMTKMPFWVWFRTVFSWMLRTSDRVQDKPRPGQVFCIRELALFLFLAADLQGCFRMCWY